MACVSVLLLVLFQFFELFVWRCFFQPEYSCRWTDEQNTEHECHMLNWENELSHSSIHYIFMSYFYSNFVFVEHFDPHEFRNACLPTDFQPFNMICRAEFYASTTSIHGSVMKKKIHFHWLLDRVFSPFVSCHLQFHSDFWFPTHSVQLSTKNVRLFEFWITIYRMNPF